MATREATVTMPSDDEPRTLQTTPSRVERRKEKTRNALLMVALDLFQEKGIYWTKIEDITERADIGKGTFYQYFQTKEDLLEVLLQQGLNELLSRIQAAVRDGDPGPGLLTRVIRAKIDFHLQHKEYLLLFHQVRGLLQFRIDSLRNLRRVYEAYLDQLGELIVPALPQGNGAGITAREFALALSAFTLGLLTHHLLFEGRGEWPLNRTQIQSQLERSLQAIM